MALRGSYQETPCFWAVWLAFVLRQAPELVQALDDAPVETRWLEAARAVAAGDFAGAADLLAEIGAAGEEAYASLLAAEASGDGDQLRRALDFYRRIGATAYLRRAGGLAAAATA